MRISLMVAMGRNGVIGDDRGMPWRLPSDLRRFRKLTLGKPIVMGRKTAALLGKPLPGRENIVLTRDRTYRVEGFHVVHDVPAAIELSSRLAQERGIDEVMVIGGGEIYRLFLASADRVYLTLVEGEFTGTATFPFEELCGLSWRLAEEDRVGAENGNSHAHRNYVLERIAEGGEAVRLLAG